MSFYEAGSNGTALGSCGENAAKKGAPCWGGKIAFLKVRTAIDAKSSSRVGGPCQKQTGSLYGGKRKPKLTTRTGSNAEEKNTK